MLSSGLADKHTALWVFVCVCGNWIILLCVCVCVCMQGSWGFCSISLNAAACTHQHKLTVAELKFALEVAQSLAR